jgi:hypothetical protein
MAFSRKIRRGVSGDGYVTDPHRRVPHPAPFLAKSAESLEKKRVEISAGAKKCKRVRKDLKGKGIGAGEHGKALRVQS